MRKFATPLAIALSLVCAAALADGPKVSRLPGVPGQPADLIKRGQPGGEDVINLTITRSHAPEISKAAGQLARALRVDAVTPRILRELTIMRVAVTVGSDYEINQHIPLAKACGYTAEKITAVKEWRASPLFDEKERAILAFVDQMMKDGNVDDAVYGKLAEQFTPREIVEIASTVANYAGTGLFTKALRIEVETDGRQAFLGKC